MTFSSWSRVELNEFCASEHSGTHLDAPVHFAKDRWGVSDIPLDRLWRVPGERGREAGGGEIERMTEGEGV